MIDDIPCPDCGVSSHDNEEFEKLKEENKKLKKKIESLMEELEDWKKSESFR